MLSPRVGTDGFVKQPPMKLICCLALVVVSSLLLAGCDVDRKLKITEVAPRVELFLDEPFNNQLPMTSMALEWVWQEPGAQPASGALNFGSAGVGPLQGGKFLVIFEDANYMGDPVAQDFRSTVPGIKVRDGFFPGYGNTRSVSMRIVGERSGTHILFVPRREKVNDVVRFGPSPRPPLVGAFNENGSLNGVWPSGGRSVSRRFAGSAPVDDDSESNWSLTPESIGVPTPP
jgi:hypothetical protein